MCTLVRTHAYICTGVRVQTPRPHTTRHGKTVHNPTQLHTHTALGTKNHLAKIAGTTEVLVLVATYLGVQTGEKYETLVAAKSAWQAMPVAHAADEGDEDGNEVEVEEEEE